MKEKNIENTSYDCSGIAVSDSAYQTEN